MGNYLAQWLVAIAILVDKSALAVVALYNAIPCSEGVRKRSWEDPLV